MWVATATAVVDTPIGHYLFRKYDNDFSHVHNPLIDIFNRSGIVGVGLFLWLLYASFVRFFWRPVGKRVLLNGLWFAALVLLLQQTEAFRLVSVPNPDWGLLWLPLVFVYVMFQTALTQGGAHDS